MADLQARYDNLENGNQTAWRHPLPEGRDIGIGRRSLTDVTVPEWNRSDWIIDGDARLSGRHATVNWNGKVLRVRRRMEPIDRQALNPIFYKGKANDDFVMAPGESFTIGSTTFALLAPESLVSDDSSEPDRFSRTLGREDLRLSSFIDARTPLMALADLPDIMRTARDDAQLEDRFLDVILKGLPLAEFAGLARIDPKDGGEARAAVTRSKQRGLTDESFQVSNRLVRHATRNVMESVLYVWDKKGEGGSRFSATIIPNTDWAICTPLDEKPQQHRSVYVAGRVPRNIFNEEQLKRDPDFQDYQKFINLAAELFCSMRETRRWEVQNARLKQFLPKKMAAMMEHQDLVKQLEPRVADVTAFFCDLRGSSRYAQENPDMMTAWSCMSEALDIMTRAIHENEGVIGGLQGDAAVGFWGWPTSLPDQIDRALRAALHVRTSFVRSRKLNQTQFDCGIGLADGAAVVGRLGTVDQFKLDAYGPVMNLAARLESLTKVFGVQILVDETIALHLEKAKTGGSQPRLRPLGKIRPAGMSVRVPIFELMPPLVDADPEEAGVPYYLWEAGIRAFVDGNWLNARRRFDHFLLALTEERRQADKAAGFFIDFMNRHRGKPPADWDGTIEMDAK